MFKFIGKMTVVLVAFNFLRRAAFEYVLRSGEESTAQGLINAAYNKKIYEMNKFMEIINHYGYSVSLENVDDEEEEDYPFDSTSIDDLRES